MNKIKKTLIVAVACFGLTSCFKDEPLNAECDIEDAWVHYDNPQKYAWNLSDTIQHVYSAEKSITFKVRPGVDRTALAPMFVTTEGAVLTPASGTVRDFSNGPLKYTVTSQDGNWQREYDVEFIEEHRTVRTTMNFDFERVSVYTDDITKKQYS